MTLIQDTPGQVYRDAAERLSAAAKSAYAAHDAWQTSDDTRRDPELRAAVARSIEALDIARQVFECEGPFDDHDA